MVVIDVLDGFITFLATPPGYVLLALLGLCVGSFLNLLCHRLPIMMIRQWLDDAEETQQEFGAFTPNAARANAPTNSAPPYSEPFNLITPRSRCPHCKHQLAIKDLIPVLSFFLLRGRCRSCNASISRQYPIIELSAAIIAVLPFMVMSNGWQATAAVVVGWIVLCLAVIDLQRGWLPDSLTMTLLWLGLICNSFSLFVSPVQAILGATLGYLLLRLVFITFRWITGKPGMGQGDFKFFAATGAWLGAYALSSTLLIAALGGILYVLILIYLSQWKSGTPIPFGPWLGLSLWLHLLLEDDKILFVIRLN